MESQPQIKNSKEIIMFLAEQFPQCFSLTGEAKPLKIGIFQDIINHLQGDMPVSRTQLRVALRIYTSSWRYLHAIKLGAFRVGLNGEQEVAIEQEHVDYAQQQLKNSKEKANAAKALIKQEKPKAPRKNIPAKKIVKSNKSAIVTNVKNDKPPVATSFTPVSDISVLTVGQSVKMLLGQHVTQVEVTEIMKDSVKVQAPSGFEVTVPVEHISI